MRLSVGIFAHNEEQQIGATLESLFEQTLLQEQSPDGLDIRSMDLVCLANGCTDATATAARGYGSVAPSKIDYRVIELPQPGKSRTWNKFVHELSDADADFLFLMDADIIFESEDVLEQLLRRLLVDPHAQVATDTPVKSIGKGPGEFSLIDRGSLAASEQKSQVGAICGQLYCARAETLRRIWLPPALPVEDGYLAAMIATSGFTCPTDLGRIAWVPTARHFFRTHTSITGYISHEARIIVGSTINSWLFTVLWEKGRSGHAGSFVEAQNRFDEDWLSRLIQNKIRAGGAWLIPSHFVFWRLESLRGQRLAQKMRRAPVAIAATLLNLLACVRANVILKRQNAAEHW